MGCGPPRLEGVERLVSQFYLPTAQAPQQIAGRNRCGPCAGRARSDPTADCPWRAGSRLAGRAQGGSGRCRRPGARRADRRKCTGCRAGQHAACPRHRSGCRPRTAKIRRRWCRSQSHRWAGGPEAPAPARSRDRCPGSASRGRNRCGRRARPARCRPCSCGVRTGSTGSCTSVRTARRSRRGGSCLGQDAGWARSKLRDGGGRGRQVTGRGLAHSGVLGGGGHQIGRVQDRMSQSAARTCNDNRSGVPETRRWTWETDRSMPRSRSSGTSSVAM